LANLREEADMSETFHQQCLATYKTSKQDLASMVKTVMNDDIAEKLPVKQGYANEVHSVKTKSGQEIIVRNSTVTSYDFVFRRGVQQYAPTAQFVTNDVSDNFKDCVTK
jgi:hypothetical protein